MKTKSTAYVVLATAILLFGLTSCASESSVPKEQPSIYQPPILHLAAGQPVVTKEGVYRPQTDEVWHSDARYRQLEEENINLAAANAQLRNK